MAEDGYNDLLVFIAAARLFNSMAPRFEDIDAEVAAIKELRTSR